MQKVIGSLGKLSAVAIIAAGTLAFTNANTVKQEGVEYIRDANYNWTPATGSENCVLADEACKATFPENYTPLDGEENYQETMSNSLQITQPNGHAQ
jgi:hypothetical protein